MTLEKQLDVKPLNKWDKISASKLNTFHACQRKFFISYRHKIKEDDTIYTDRGRFCHTVLEIFFEPKKYPFYGADFMVQQMETRLLDIFNASLQDTLFLKDNEEMMQETQEALLFYITGVALEFQRLCRKYNQWAAWSMIRPKFRELALETEYTMGFIDSIHENGTGDNKQVFITDYKTSSIWKVPYNAEYEAQLYFYAYMYYLTTAIMPDSGIIDYILYGKAVYLKFNPEKVLYVGSLVEELVLKREKYWNYNDFEHWPRNSSYQWCKNCPYRTMTQPNGEPWCDVVEAEES